MPEFAAVEDRRRSRAAGSRPPSIASVPSSRSLDVRAEGARRTATVARDVRRRRSAPRSSSGPSASAASSTARCEIDLSPGGRTSPATRGPTRRARRRRGPRAARLTAARPRSAARAPRGARRERPGAVGVEHHDEHARGPLLGVRDLEVVDVEVRLARDASSPRRGRRGGPARARAARRGRSGRASMAGRLRRAALAAVSSARMVARSLPAMAASRVARRPRSAARPARIASRLSTQTSGQIAGWPAATRVMSRKPPAARRSRAASLSASSAASFIIAPATRCGHVAHHRDEAVVVLRGERERGRAEVASRPRRASRSARGVVARRRGEHPGRARRRGRARAPRSPDCSEPAIGWPPTYRGSSIAVDERRLHARDVGDDEVAGADRGELRRATAATTCEDGTATMATSVARCARAVPSTTPRASAVALGRRRRGPRRSPTSPRRAARARPSPRRGRGPTTWARAASVGEVIAQLARAVEVDVVQLVAGTLGVQVHEHADAPSASRPGTSISVAHSSGTAAEPERARRGRGEHRAEVGRGGEQDRDQVVARRAVALEELAEQLGRALGDRSAVSSSTVGRATERTDDLRHRCSVPKGPAPGRGARSGAWTPRGRPRPRRAGGPRRA